MSGAPIIGVCVLGVDNPHTVSDKATLESVQRHAARWVCGSRWSPVRKHWSKSSDVCLQELHWPTLSS